MTTDQAEQPEEEGRRRLGKWDYIACAIFTLLEVFATHDVSASVEEIENLTLYMIGSFIGVLALWAIIKVVFF